MTDLHIKPVPGLVVRDPETYEPLAASGEKKPRNGFWLRRLKDGDVIDANIVSGVTDTTDADQGKAQKKGTNK